VPPEGRTRDRLALALATVLGIGFMPIAPGTWGSLPGLALAFLLDRWAGGWAVLGGAVVVALVGTWAADRAARSLQSSDPGPVVIDEVAGQMLTLAFVPRSATALIAAFFLFRALDVWKPWPANRLEDLPGGSGIMADDLMAGLYGNVLLRLLAHWQPGWLGVA